jgi:hypothetical protein
MLMTIAIILAILWLLGLIAHVGGALIHLILIIALVVFVFHFITGRKKV